MTLEGVFQSYVSGVCFGAGLITAAVLMKLVFHVGFCG